MMDLTRLTLNVTQEDIDQGCKTSSCNCPIARSARRVVPAGYEVMVDGFNLILFAPFGSEMAVRRYPMPWEGRAFVRSFDSGREVFPFEFELEVAA